MQTAGITSNASGISAGLSDFVSEASWSMVPNEVRHEIRRALMNYFAVSLAGAREPTLDIAVRTYGRFSCAKDATIIGRAERMDMLNAAALNSMSANVFDFDDTHIPTIIHPTAPVAAALFAMSETRAISGKEFMLAFLLGVEVACRIGRAVSPFHYRKGWHITSTCGVFGSGVAIGKVIGLSPEQLGWMFGNAAGQAGGLVESLGTMSKSVSAGNAARNGIVSALLAADNFDGPAQPLEGRYGFLNVYGDEPEIDRITAGLGHVWELSQVAYKPYPCGVVLNPVVDACLNLSSRIAAMPAGQISDIELTGHPLLRQRTDRPGIRKGKESQVSAQHAVAVALMRGRAGLDDFSDAAVIDPALRKLGARVRFHDDTCYSINSAKVVIRFQNGEMLEESVDVARGALERPLTDVELESKLCDLSEYGGSTCDTRRVIDAIWHIDEMADVSALMRLVGQAPSLQS